MCTIAGKDYYQFQCRLEDVSDNNLVTKGATAGLYTKAQFKQDISCGNRGFSVQFDQFDVVHHFNWRQILCSPLSIMFFSASLTTCRSFDRIFKDITTLQSLHWQLILYYDHVKGDVEASLSLFNTYIMRKAVILHKMFEDEKKDRKDYNGDLFRPNKVKDF